MKTLTNLAFALMVGGVMTTAPAYAYIDPASISMALQVAIGAIASGLIAAKLYLHRIIGFFRRGERPSSRDGSGPTA